MWLWIVGRHQKNISLWYPVLHDVFISVKISLSTALNIRQTAFGLPAVHKRAPWSSHGETAYFISAPEMTCGCMTPHQSELMAGC